MEAKVYNQKGKEVGTVTLPVNVFGARFNADLVHQVVTSMQSNERDPIAHAKTRGEVRGGGKKPWQQKGTGRARHGSSRSPLWVGGGTTHGPRNDRNWHKRIPHGMKLSAFASVLSKKHTDGEILFLESLEIPTGKTRDAKDTLGTISSVKGFELVAGKKKNAIIIAVEKKTPELSRSFQNIGNVLLEEVRNLNPLTLLTYRFLALSPAALAVDVLTSRFQKKEITAKTPAVSKEPKTAKAKKPSRKAVK
jgi:large subunit ribosomal protein L4